MLGDVARMVQLRHMAGGEADLVAVGGVPRRRRLGDLPLGQLAGEGVLKAGPWVAAAGDTHGLMDVGPARQGVPDAPADAGGRAAEGLDLRGMVMGLVLEHEQPVLLLPVHYGGNMDGAGVDFLALVQLGEQAPLFQRLRADGGNVHQGLGPLGGLLLAVHLHPGRQIAFVGRLHAGIIFPVRSLDLNILQMGGKSGMAAVVGPVGIHHPHLGNGGVPMLGVPEVGLQKCQVVQVHGQPQPVQQGGEAVPVQPGEARQRLHHRRRAMGADQGLRLLHGGLPALHGVDEVALNLLQILPAQLSLQQVHLGVADQGPLHAGHQLYALGAGVGPLVELPRQGLHRQQAVNARGLGERLVPHHVHLGLGEYDVLCLLIDGGLNPLHVITVQDADALYILDPQEAPQVPQKVPGLRRQAGTFFHKNPIDHYFFSSSAFIARRPMSRRQQALSK